MRSQSKTPNPNRHQLDSIFSGCGIELSPVQLHQFWTYHRLLRTHNQELGLTRIHNFTSMVLKLYIDSVLPGTLTALPSPILDIGTGPGMPGIPLKIMYPHLRVLLAESRQRRVGFLEKAVEALGLKNVQIVPRSISEDYDRLVDGVITRAVESISATLHRVGNCLKQNGHAIFMKGPGCDKEIEAAVKEFSEDYRLVHDHAYRIGVTEHERRLVIFERISAPESVLRFQAQKRHAVKTIASDQNRQFKVFKKLLSTRGIKKHGMVLVSGSKTMAEIFQRFPGHCRGWIGIENRTPPPPDAPAHLTWYCLKPSLHRVLDVFGTHAPLLLIKPPEIDRWEVSDGFPRGCSLLIPFQDPENVGAAIRSAVAFNVNKIILLAECAHPYHPKAVRASGGTVFSARLFWGPSLAELPNDLPLTALSKEGTPLSKAVFPEAFGFLPGIEGPGLPESWRRKSVSIPIQPSVESLNASVAVAIALYEWSQRQAMA
jgi:16S rRNA (guanine527-N7)-methyltransferase